MIETIEDVDRRGILVEGAEWVAHDSERELATVCYNFQAWQIDKESRADPKYQPPIRLVTFDGSEPKRMFRVDTGGMEERFCLINVNISGSGYEVCSFDGFSGVHFGNCPDWGFSVPAYYALPPNTPIAALAKLAASSGADVSGVVSDVAVPIPPEKPDLPM